MARGRARSILFRIFYSTTFTIVFLLTVTCVCIGPIDTVYQSYRRGRYIDLFVIAGIYFLTALIAVFLYASRLYTNRSILKDIPKAYLPLDKAEVANRRVWRLIENCKSRSAVVAYLARPRARRVEEAEGMGYVRGRIETLLKPEHDKKTTIFEPRWGTISHPGWSGPAAKDTPNLEYGTVVAELTDLIEARAVSLAPVDPSLGVDAEGNAMVDEYLIEALRRPEEVGMRQYVSQLVSLGAIEDNSLVMALLTLYERARFAPQPLSEDEFKTLMRMFAEVLRTMKSPKTELMNFPNMEEDDHDGSITEPDTALPKPDDVLCSRNIQFASNTGAMASSSSLADSIAGSVRRHLPRIPTNRSASFATAIVAPPRMSHDSVRSVSSAGAYHDIDGDTDGGASWTESTSRPPFFRARSSQSAISRRSRGRGGGSRTTSSRNMPRRRSRLRRAISRASIETGRSSIRTLRSTGSVVRLNAEYDGSREQLPFEYITHGPDGDQGPPRRQ